MVHIDKYIKYFDPGQVLMITARAGCGKTTLGMQLINGLVNSFQSKGLFTSLEMPNHDIFARCAIIEKNKDRANPLTTECVFDELMKDEIIKKQTIEQWKNLLIIDRDSLTLEQIENYFQLANDKCGHKIEALMIDYGGLIRGSDNYEGISKIARGIKSLAKRLHTRIIIVVQLSRAAKDGKIRVTMDMLRDTGAWEESADYILGCWLSPSDPKRIHSSVLKNRYGDRDIDFDIINQGLFYYTEDFKPETQSYGF